ncbi:unnamed protein product, partial [Urochloa humidicola]
ETIENADTPSLLHYFASLLATAVVSLLRSSPPTVLRSLPAAHPSFLAAGILRSSLAKHSARPHPISHVLAVHGSLAAPPPSPVTVHWFFSLPCYRCPCLHPRLLPLELRSFDVPSTAGQALLAPLFPVPQNLHEVRKEMTFIWIHSLWPSTAGKKNLSILCKCRRPFQIRIRTEALLYLSDENMHFCASFSLSISMQV